MVAPGPNMVHRCVLLVQFNVIKASEFVANIYVLRDSAQNLDFWFLRKNLRWPH